jgi:hypothetical protein
MRYSIFILFSFLLLSLTSCRTDFDTVPSSGKLEFSDETVYLDTIFSQISSSTYQLKVYNRSNDDIKIPTIRLEKPDSKYRLMVDGRSDNNGKRFDNVELLAKDSLFIFIETTVVNAVGELEFTYEDKILFDEGTNQQNVKLVTLIRDACFFKPDRSLDGKIYETINVEGFEPDTQGHVLKDSDFTPNGIWKWTNMKPYVIYGNLVVPNGKTLTINKGTQVYFHDNATLIVDTQATLKIEGDLNDTNSEGIITNRKEVTFEGDRLEPIYENVPGQWGTVFIFSSNNNKINYLTLKNASVGLFVLPKSDSVNFPKLEITNSQIYDCSNFGILARQANVTGINLVMNSAGQACLAGSLGGSYDFTHCTFNNEWPSTTQVAVILNNYIDDTDDLPIPLIAKFDSSIIYGSNQSGILLDIVGDQFVPNFKYCLFKLNSTNPIFNNNIYSFINGSNNPFNNKKNIDPKFKNSDKNQLNILTINSGAYNGGNPINAFPDILNTLPQMNFDIGAYQFIPNP